jgi:RNA polymerase sigma factor (sigma-70 family)
MIDRNEPFDLERWYPDVVRIVMSRFKGWIPANEKEDILQDIFLALLHKSKSCNSEYNAFRSAPSHYICLVARNVLINRLPKKKSLALNKSLDALLEEAPKILDNHQISTEKALNMKDKLEKFESFLIQRDPSLFKYYQMVRDGYTFTEVGKLHNKNPNNIKERVESVLELWSNKIKNFPVQSIFGVTVFVKHWKDLSANSIISEQ